MTSNRSEKEHASHNISVVEIAPDVTEAYNTNDKGDIILNSGLKAGLKNRMINLIALCGILSPGVFLGLGTMLASGGPASMLIGFAIVGLLVISMMYSIGELNATYDQNFAILGSRFVSKGFGATVAVFYVIIWITNIISEYTSLAAAMSVFTDKVPSYGWILIFWTFFAGFQTLDISWWGETEYILGFIKLGFLTIFYIFAIVYAAGALPHKPNNPFGNYPLNHGFKGIANNLVLAAVYYSGVEGVSILASESRNPRKAIPVAVKNTVFRVFYVYFGLSVFYGITVAYNDPMITDDNKVMRSPMAIALRNAGWAQGTYLISALIMITCLSSINSAIYFASRGLFTLSREGFGPKIFTKVNYRGVPYVAIHFVHLWGFLSMLSYGAGSRVAYTYVVSVTGVASFMIWTCISIIHLRFRRAYLKRDLPLRKLHFIAPLFPWSNYFAITLGIILTLIQSWSCFVPFDYKTFIDGYIMLPLFFIFWFCYDYFYFKKGLIKLEEIDFEYGRRPDLDDTIGVDLDQVLSTDGKPSN